MSMIGTNVGMMAAQPHVTPMVLRKEGLYRFGRVCVAYRGRKVWLHGPDADFLALIRLYDRFGYPLDDAAVAKVYPQYKSAPIAVDGLRRWFKIKLTPQRKPSDPKPKVAFDADRIFVRCRGKGYRLAKKGLHIQHSRWYVARRLNGPSVNGNVHEPVVIDRGARDRQPRGYPMTSVGTRPNPAISELVLSN